MGKNRPQKTVAVIGTGMAGLVTAYLLHHDPQRRYRVQLLEKRNQVSLSAESLAVPSSKEPKKTVWADVPMRAFAAGFYDNLIRLYDHLGVSYHPQSFLFTFSRPSPAGRQQHPYMVHTSNFHQRPPIPRNADILGWIVEVLYVLLCYAWFTFCCFLVSPTHSGETLDQYLRRIRLPPYYTASYLLPLISSVCTCSHHQLLQFPAKDVLDYKTRTHRMNHYVVSDGVHSVQEKLLQGLDVRLGVQSFRVSPVPSDGGVEITTRDSSSGKEATERFDFVVLAVSPDIVARVFKPLQSALESIPTTTVETVAHTDSSLVSSSSPGKGSVSDQEPGSAQHISFLSDSDSTESTHQQPTSVLVTTNPLSDIEPSKIIQSASFTRVLRTPESRALVNELFRENEISQSVKGAEGWRNGDNGVFLAGGWCWDGMVLLEGCVVSAMRVASALGVEVPW